MASGVANGHFEWSYSQGPRFVSLTMTADFENPVSWDRAVQRLDEAAALSTRPNSLPWRWWVTDPTPAHTETAAAAGWHQARSLFHLQRPVHPVPDSPEVPGVTIRPALLSSGADSEPGGDEAEILRVNNAAFDWHPDQREWTLADIRRTIASAWFDPRDVLVAADGDTLSGFCWMKRHGDDRSSCEIFVIAVDPAAHGRGLGRLLVTASLHHAAAVGCDVADLWCEADNTAALGLYRSMGYEATSQSVAFAPPAPGVSVADASDNGS